MPQYAGFWLRFVAYIIDTLIINTAVYMISFVMGIGIGASMAGADADFIAAIAGVIGGLFGLVATWLYFAIGESSSWQATVGKKALGLVVTDENAGRIGFGRATGRYFAKILSSLILLFGFFMIGWTQRKQGLHDMIASTLVYKARSPAELGSPMEVFR